MAHAGKVGGVFLFLWPYCTACGILVPSPGIEPVPPGLEARSLNLWTAREVLCFKSLDFILKFLIHFELVFLGSIR